MDEREFSAVLGIVANGCCGREEGQPGSTRGRVSLKLLGEAVTAGTSSKVNPPTSPAAPAVGNRLHIWQIAEKMHCSVLGTCLPLGEFIAIGRRVGYKLDPKASAYEIHAWAVDQMVAPNELARRVDKAIEKRYGSVAKRVRAARSESEIETLWRQVHGEGLIAGAYWGAMSHPMCGYDLRWRIFGEIHMLSHLVGASRRADLCRLHELELATAEQNLRHQQLAADYGLLLKKNKRLAGELSAQQEQTRQFEKKLADARERETAFEVRTHSRERQARIAELEALLLEARAERASAESCAAELRTQLDEATTDNQRKRGQLDELAAENGALELELTRNAAGAQEGPTPDLGSLGGMRLLYVGGRTNLVPYYRSLVEDRGGMFLHHDGGLEQSLEAVARVLSNVDVVICPVDCVSHAACLLAKQACRNLGKTFIPLRSAGLSSLARAIHAMGAALADSTTTAKYE
jgi:Uncharacterized protein conserved in bacteria (DUF2325)